MRIGFGYDSHRFADEERPLKLGGVLFPGERGLKAHSDGDVVLHAIIDALFGAAAMGDIGRYFPDTDPRWHNADSRMLLRAAMEEIRETGYRVGNIDVTIICERPKIGPRVEEIRASLAADLGVAMRAVSVKGKTNEKMDDVGAGCGIVVHAVVLLEETPLEGRDA